MVSPFAGSNPAVVILKRTIESLVKELESYKTVFNPSKEEYLRFLFEFNYQLCDCFGDTTKQKQQEIVPLIKACIEQDIEDAKVWYRKRLSYNKVLVPTIEQAKYYARETYLRDKKKK